MAEKTGNKFKPKASSNLIEGATPVSTVEDVPVEETTTPVEESTPATVVTFEDKAPKAPVQKNVKVCTKVNHSCTIGGVTYHFTKGKQTNVPPNVKTILLQADLLMPL